MGVTEDRLFLLLVIRSIYSLFFLIYISWQTGSRTLPALNYGINGHDHGQAGS